MKTRKVCILLLALTSISLSATIVFAGDFDWTRELNMKAEAEPLDFRARLSTRFNIGDAQVKIVLDNVDHPADAYIVLRMAEMSSRPAHYVLNKYKAEKSKGWGILGKSLGVKPGSREFHALKQGNDLYTNETTNNKHKKSKSKGKS